MPGGASVTVLDGHDSIGGTKILVASSDRRLLLDFGTNYRRMSRFYEEFLQPRVTRGITDFLEVGLLPRRRGLYRRDLFPAADYPSGDAAFEGSAPDAVLLSHAHLDHCGALAFVDPSIPVVATPGTLAVLRAWQETGRSDIASEVTYYTPRAAAGDGLVTPATAAGRRRRDFRVFGEVPSGLAEALAAPPGKRGGLEGPPPRSAAGDAALRSFGVRAFPVDHSLPGSCAFLLDVDGARLAYTGDLRFHGGRAAETEAFLRELERRSPDVLLVEGTRLRPPDTPGPAASTSEAEVHRRAEAAVRAYDGRLVVADFGPRNVERLATFRAVAAATGRELVVTAKDAYLLRLLHAVDATVPVDLGPGGMRIWEEPTVRARALWQERVRAWYGDATVGPEAIGARPGRFLLCFSFFDANDLVDLRGATPGGAWVYSSSEAHGEEQEFDFARLAEWIAWAGMTPVGFHLDPATHRPVFAGGLHASGHATQEELVELVRRSNARRIVPVHSERPGRYRDLLGPEGARVELPVPGRPLRL